MRIGVFPSADSRCPLASSCSHPLFGPRHAQVFSTSFAGVKETSKDEDLIPSQQLLRRSLFHIILCWRSNFDDVSDTSNILITAGQSNWSAELELLLFLRIEPRTLESRGWGSRSSCSCLLVSGVPILRYYVLCLHGQVSIPFSLCNLISRISFPVCCMSL